MLNTMVKMICLCDLAEFNLIKKQLKWEKKKT